MTTSPADLLIVHMPGHIARHHRAHLITCIQGRQDKPDLQWPAGSADDHRAGIVHEEPEATLVTIGGEQPGQQPVEPSTKPKPIPKPRPRSASGPVVAPEPLGNPADAADLRCQQECLICMDQPKSVLLAPCGHVVVLEVCRRVLWSQWLSRYRGQHALPALPRADQSNSQDSLLLRGVNIRWPAHHSTTVVLPDSQDAGLHNLCLCLATHKT